jgi:hypothetical protein
MFERHVDDFVKVVRIIEAERGKTSMDVLTPTRLRFREKITAVWLDHGLNKGIKIEQDGYHSVLVAWFHHNPVNEVRISVKGEQYFIPILLQHAAKAVGILENIVE